jgi:pyrimidine-nucleoside phosphorylase
LVPHAGVADPVADAVAVTVAVADADADAVADADADAGADADADGVADATDVVAEGLVVDAVSFAGQPIKKQATRKVMDRIARECTLSLSQRMQRSIVELIAAKRDGQTLSPEDIQRLIRDLMEGRLADYQLSAFLMAAYLRGLSDGEAVALTDAMLRSGQVLDLSSVPGIKVDKHSTGGVGDKVSLCLAPLVAACGVPVPMVSGRGLGHTGGTLDKLEAIPGFRTDLAVEDFARIVGSVGTCLIGQTKEIAPADKRIYAIRDVTATVECIPLIVASILSKKLAEGIDALVLDVKVGSGAFMKDLDRARELASALVRVGVGAGKKVVALLTDMEAPLGSAVGNACETMEAIDILHGKGPADLLECTLALGTEMLVLGKKSASSDAGRAALQKAITDGSGAKVFRKMIEAQHGDPRVVDDPSLLDLATTSVEITADRSGFVTRADALEIGRAAVAMGAGRMRAEDAVDHGVGAWLRKKPGHRVEKGETLITLRMRKRDVSVEERMRNAFSVDDAPLPTRKLIIDRIEG